jgi:predicted transcriptional regulator
MNSTSIRLPDALKQRINRAAEHAGTTPHAFMLEAIAERVEAEERQRDFQAVAEQRYLRIVEGGETIPWSEMHPLIGRPVRGDLRELVIGRRARGYVALYRYVPELDTAFVLAIRGQREAGYSRD